MPQQRQAATALITGGRRGIGLAIAIRLAADGHPIAVTGSGEADASTRAAVAELEKYGVPVGYFASDIAATAGHAAVLDSIERQLGPIAVLVSNAGIAPPERLDVLDTTTANFDAVLNTNLRGAFFFAQAVAKRMLALPAAEGARSIVFISSCSAQMVSVNRLEYCVAKAGLAMVAQGMAARLAADGIGVFEVRPGIIRTDMTAGVNEKYDRLIGDGLVPARRWGQGDDIAAAVAMLIKPEAFFATGSVIHADGGLTCNAYRSALAASGRGANNGGSMSPSATVRDTGRRLLAGEYGYGDLQPGDRYDTQAITLTESHIVAFAGITGDFFDVHMDDTFARQQGFPGRIAHGLLGLALIDGLKTRSAVRLCSIATLGWNWSFCAPLLPGDRIDAEITVVSKRPTKRADRGIVTFALRMINQHEAVVQQGETLLMMQQ